MRIQRGVYSGAFDCVCITFSLRAHTQQVKTLGVRKIVQLAKNDPTNLEEFIENEPLMGALSRVLQDDYRLGYELVVPLCSLFCIFSKYSEMHLVLRNKAIGTMVIKILELEISRYDLRLKKMKEYRKAVEVCS